MRAAARAALALPFITCSVFFGLNSALAQVTLPATPAGVTMSAWLDAFNSGDRARLDDYYKKYDPAKHGDDRDFRDRGGGFELVAITKSDPLRIVCLLKEQNSETRALAKMQWPAIALMIDSPSASRLRAPSIP